LFDRRAHGSENLCPMLQKDFCNKIGTFETSPRRLRECLFIGGTPEVIGAQSERRK
jgi:hypothetical protein